MVLSLLLVVVRQAAVAAVLMAVVAVALGREGWSYIGGSGGGGGGTRCIWYWNLADEPVPRRTRCDHKC